MTRANISTLMNKVIKTSCKSFTANFLTVLGLIVESITSIEKKGYLEAPNSLGKIPLQ